MKYPQPSVSNPDPSARILIVRLSAHGDVMHTLPLLASIKRHKPDAFIGWLVEASAAPLLEDHPLIDRLHVVDRKRWMKLIQNPAQWLLVWREVQSFIGEIQEAGYHISFDVQGLLKSALWPVLSNIPIRYGFKATREFADLLYNRHLPPMSIRDAHTPAVQSYLGFARAIGCPVEPPEFVLSPVQPLTAQKVEDLLAGLAHPEWPLVVLAPFTRWPSKHWPLNYWQTLVPELLKLKVRVLMLGAPSNRADADEMVANANPDRLANWVGQTDWPDLYALFPRTCLLIGLDSAPLHVADAVNGPTIIGLYGPTAPGRTGPVGVDHTVLSTALSCQPCFERHCPIQTHACMTQLTPEIILGVVKQTLTAQGFSV
ncbi:glycosyltransferase family 9 protein [Vampirovibrio sp.]|uniref:glycosyltransferase family 9 protein n=1 Tax=Vampirovibrio sp. TaxID=2717857 RepID=UPI003593F910